MRNKKSKVVLLTVLLGVGLYALRQLLIIIFYAAAEILGIGFEVVPGQWPVQAILVSAAVDIGFLVAALATGKHLLTRLTVAERGR